MSARGHSLHVGDRYFAAGGSVSTCLTLAWLATHRGRLRSLVLGGHRLSILVVWDCKGREELKHSEEEVAALTRIVYGPPRAPVENDATCDIPNVRPFWR